MQRTRNLSTVVLVSALGWLFVAAGLEAQRVRPNVDSLSPEEQAVLQEAMKAIKALPDSDPMSYGYLRDTHDGLNGPCEHGSEVFLPWHRELLLRFENALRASGVDGAESIVLPYWDWSLPPSGERYPAIAEDPGSEFYHAGRNPPGGSPLPLEDLAAARAKKTWPDFGGLPLPSGGFGYLERPPHNYMHSSYVAGDMQADFTAARDPLFWLFHNGIDFYWWDWQERNPGQDPVNLSQTLRGFGGTTVGDVLDTEALGYTFAMSEQEKTRVHEGFQAEIAALAGTRRARAFESYTFDFTVPSPGFERAELHISEVKLAGAASHVVRYYAHPAGVAFRADDPSFQKYLAATDAHFGGPPAAGKAHGHHPPRGEVRVDVTKALARLARSHAGEAWIFTAVYEGPNDRKTGRPSDVLLGRDVDQGAIHLVIERE